MKLMKKIWEAAKSDRKKIVLPEGNEERTMKAAQKINVLGLAYPILIGNRDEIIAKSKELDVDLTGIEIIDPEHSENLGKYIEGQEQFIQLVIY